MTLVAPRRNEPLVNPDGTPTVRAAEYLERNADQNEYTEAEKLKLAGIETGATADQTGAEIEAGYNSQVGIATQAEAEAGILNEVRRWTPERVGEAVLALGNNLTVISASTSYTAGSEDVVLANATLGEITVTLPAANTRDKPYEIKNVGTANSIVIDPDGSETIDGASTLTLWQQNASVTLISDGSNWRIV